VSITPAGAQRGQSTKRAVDGIVLLDKPRGPSSNQALQRVRRLLNAAKAGHAGTLDPLATGMLPLCFGQATKTCGALLGARKAYRVGLELGAATTTGDAEGDVNETAPVPTLEFDVVARRLTSFLGTHEQVPPMHSALKLHGRTLYQRARAGEVVERPPRSVWIHALTLRTCERSCIEFDVECSKGTYVRVLGEDIARNLGTVGHLCDLRRLWVEPFAGEAMVMLDAIEQWSCSAPANDVPPWLLPVDRGLAAFPRLQLDDESARALRQGKTIAVRADAGTMRVYGPDAGFLGLIDIDSAGRARVRRFFVGAPLTNGPRNA